MGCGMTVHSILCLYYLAVWEKEREDAMLSEQRQGIILKILEERRSVTVMELTKIMRKHRKRR